jgi:hypothetical protein
MWRCRIPEFGVLLRLTSLPLMGAISQRLTPKPSYKLTGRAPSPKAPFSILREVITDYPQIFNRVLMC